MNYYEILKVSKDASDTEIKSSYKKLVKKYHPDLYVGDKEFAEQKLKQINEAYDILSNPEMKAEYDEYLNPKPNPSSYVNSVPTYTANSYTENPKDTSSSPEPDWSFTHFLAEKFNLLDKKKQLQIFILILVIILTLFLINLIQVQFYLKNQSDSFSSPKGKETQNTPQNSTTSDKDFYIEDDFQTFDDFLYDLFESYENASDNIPDNSFQEIF